MRVWDVAAQETIYIFDYQNEVDSVAFSPDGSLLASGSEDRTILLWLIAGGRALRFGVLTDHREGVDALAFSPDGKLLASGSDDLSVILWDVATGKPLRQLRGHKGGIKSVVFTPNGKILISGSEDQSIRFWSVATGAQLGRPLTQHRGPIESLSLNRDGTLLASGGADRVVLWDIAPLLDLGQSSQKLDRDLAIARACRAAKRNLTESEWHQYLPPDQPYSETCRGPVTPAVQ